MSPKVSEEDFVQFKLEDVLHASQSLIAVSSILTAVADQYAHTGRFAVGAAIHCSNVIDDNIERLGLADLEIEQKSTPF